MGYFALVTFVICIASMECAWVKEMEDPNLFQGDMVLTPDQQSALRKAENGYASIPANRWPGGKIPYTISSMGRQGINAINAAIADYHKYTCLRFTPRKNERDYVNFYRGGGCSSYVGYSGGKHGISLGTGCEYKGTAMHEMGHAIGLYHEQSRPDRDSNVRIIWGNIQSGMAYNFNKLKNSEIDSLGTPYDFRSMMHYGSTAFGSRRRTIETINPNNQGLIGNRAGFSDIDIKQINLMYCGGGGVKPTCADRHTRCQEWANRTPSECKVNPRYMNQNCQKSCKLC